ncbi:hypothetical protein EJ110_NYTH19398 [Nymphaea thermarum]|nr:hypothetical protein EJ110_NYTH19398 [Nymphaea thermarum]
MSMVVVRLSSSILGAGIRWSSNSPIDYFPSSPRLRLVRVPTSCKARSRPKNSGPPYRRHQARKIPLNRQPLNDDNSSFLRIENIENEVDAQDRTEDSAEKSAYVDSGTEQIAKDTVHSSDGSIGSPDVKETSVQFLDHPVLEVNSDYSIGVPDARGTAIQFLGHPVLDDRSLPNDYGSKATTSPVDFVADPDTKPAQCSDLVTDTAKYTDPVIDTASASAPDAIETPIQFLDHPVLDERSLLIDYDSNATQTANPALESAQCSDPVTDNANYSDPVTGTTSISVPDAMQTPAHFLGHPVLGERSLLIDYDNNATRTASVNFLADPPLESAQSSNPVAENAIYNDPVTENANYTDPVTDNQSFTDATQYSEAITDAATQSVPEDFVADSALESAERSDPVTGNANYTYPVTDAPSYTDPDTDATHYPEVIIDGLEQRQEAGSDGSTLGREARGDVSSYDFTLVSEAAENTV